MSKKLPMLQSALQHLQMDLIIGILNFKTFSC